MPSGNEIQQPGSGLPAESNANGNSLARTGLTLLLLIAFQLPIVGWIVPGKSFSALVGGEGAYWAMTFMILAYVMLIERRPLSSIGLKRLTWKSLAFGVAGGLVMIGGAALIYVVIFPALGIQVNQAAAGMSAVQSTPFWFQFLLVLRAAVFEEIFYRGFAIERLTEITGLRWLAALISLAGFTFAHLSYWGWVPLIVVAFQGAILTGLYLLRRNLGTSMIAHFVSDAIAFLLL